MNTVNKYDALSLSRDHFNMERELFIAKHVLESVWGNRQARLRILTAGRRALQLNVPTS